MYLPEVLGCKVSVTLFGRIQKNEGEEEAEAAAVESQREGYGDPGAAITNHSEKIDTKVTLPDLGQNSRDQAEGWEGISLEAVPQLEQGIHARRLKIYHRRKVHRKTVIQRGGKKVCRRRRKASEQRVHSEPKTCDLRLKESATTFSLPGIN